jgi:hypothetical protein
MRSLILASLLVWGSARADEVPAHCAVRVIQALPHGSGFDARITRLRKQLEQPPFTAWHHFKLLGEENLTVALHESGAFVLPNGKPASVTYVEHVERPDGKHRLRMRLEIEGRQGQAMPPKDLSTVFVLDEGGVVLQAGQKYQEGILILGISCSTH